jgi:hypothetical protein
MPVPSRKINGIMMAQADRHNAFCDRRVFVSEAVDFLPPV